MGRRRWCRRRGCASGRASRRCTTRSRTWVRARLESLMRARCCGDPERVTATTEPRGGGPYNTCYTDHIIYITGERAPGLAAWLLKHPQQRGRGRRHQELVSLCREPCVWGRAGVVFQGRELCDCLARSDVGVGAGDMLARAMVRHDAHIAKRN